MGINGEKIITMSAAFNEETRIGDFLEKFKELDKSYVDTILVVNDGSTDNTAEVAMKLGATVVSHKKRKGLGSTIKTGIKYAIEHNYSIIIFIAPNGKDDPREIPSVVKPILENGADYVQGSRYLNGIRTGENMPFLRRFATKLHPSLIKLATGFPATDSTNGFRAVKVSLFKDPRINIWQDWLDSVSLEFYFYLMVLKFKYKLVEAPVTKIYPKVTHHFNYSKSGSMTKTRPIIDWWRILKPLVFYMCGVLK